MDRDLRGRMTAFEVCGTSKALPYPPVAEPLKTLVTLGQAHQTSEGWSWGSREEIPLFVAEPVNHDHRPSPWCVIKSNVGFGTAKDAIPGPIFRKSRRERSVAFLLPRG